MLERFHGLAAAAPDAVALIDGARGKITTRAQLAGRIDELATRFASAGFRERDVVAIQLPNSVDLVAGFGAILKQNLVVIPIDRDATETEVARILGHFSARGLVYRNGADVLISTRSAQRVALPENARLIKLRPRDRPGCRRASSRPTRTCWPTA